MDIWAIGTMLYRLLTLAYPFKNEENNDKSRIEQFREWKQQPGNLDLKDDPYLKKVLSPIADGELKDLLIKIFRVDYKERVEIKEVKEELERILKSLKNNSYVKKLE